MMKFIRKLICLLLLFSFIPVVNAADTLGDYRQELKELQAKKAANDAKKSKTQSQINQENNNIASANAAVEQAKADIETAKAEIEKSNQDIAKTKEESQKLLVFYQIMNGEDDMLQYITGASTTTDLIMRKDAVDQILSYNKDKLAELEALIQKNEQLQVELAQKQEDLKVKIKEYEASLSSLENDLSSLVEVSMSVEDEIKSMKELISYYESIGCKDNQALSTCMSIGDTPGWKRPTNRGYISSGFGYRTFRLNGNPNYTDYHNAVDVAGNAGGTPVYATANGMVVSVVRQASCGGNQVYLNVRVNGVAYTIVYAHLLSVNVSVGQAVNQLTQIGSVGGGGSTLRSNGGWDTCSTGYHLHYGVARGFYLGGKCSECYNSYSKFVSNSIVPPSMPGYGVWYYSR